MARQLPSFPVIRSRGLDEFLMERLIEGDLDPPSPVIGGLPKPLAALLETAALAKFGFVSTDLPEAFAHVPGCDSVRMHCSF